MATLVIENNLYKTSTTDSVWNTYGTGATATYGTGMTKASTIWYDYNNCTAASDNDLWWPAYGTNCYGTNKIYTTVSSKEYCQFAQWLDQASNAYYRWTWYDSHITPTVRSPRDRLREIIQSRHAPAVLRSRKHLALVQDPREIRARETLRRVLGEEKFRRFLRDGFTTVQARSGLVYQIFPGHNMTNVYRDGRKIERLCVVLRGNFPPTDSLIMRYLLILNDERDFRSHANKFTVYPENMQPQQVSQQESLTEVYRRLKVA